MSSCLRCGGEAQDDAQICDGCADACFTEPRFFLNPVLVGESIYSRLRSMGSAVLLLGPSSRSDVQLVPSSDLDKALTELNPQLVQREQLKSLYKRCNSTLAHLGVPLKVDTPGMILTEDAVTRIMTVIQKVNALETMFPQEGLSDLYIRMGVVYWNSTRSVLFKTSSKTWSDSKKAYLVSKAKEYFSKVGPGDDLYSIAARNRGMLCLEVQEWTEAEEYLSQAMAHFSNDVRIGEAIARAHLGLGNNLEALSKVDDTMALGEKPELWVLKGKILEAMERDDEAIECVNRALALDPKHMPAYDVMINILRKLGRLEQAALAESQRSLSRRPQLEGRIATIVSEFKRAASEERLEEPVSRAPPKPEPMMPEDEKAEAPLTPIASARKALDAKEYDSAIQLAIEALRDAPDSKDAALVQIEALVSKGDLAEAAPKIHEFYEKHRDDPESWFWRGELAAREGKWGASVQYFSKAVSLDPQMVDAWVSMGNTLLAHGKINGADESYSRALQLDADHPKAWLGKARTMRSMGRWGAAIQCLEKYSSLVPSDASSWVMKGDILFDKEKWERAIESYDRYISILGDESYVLGRKGIALNMLGRTDEARACLEESVRLDANNKEAARWLKVVSSGGVP